jgi:hypothetical protein
MGMRPGDKDLEQEHREAERQRNSANHALCVEAVTEWNRLMDRRRKPGWSPTIGVALAARFFWLDVFCPGCRQVKQVDLRKLDRHHRQRSKAFTSLIAGSKTALCDLHHVIADHHEERSSLQDEGAQRLIRSIDRAPLH